MLSLNLSIFLLGVSWFLGDQAHPFVEWDDWLC